MSFIVSIFLHIVAVALAVIGIGGMIYGFQTGSGTVIGTGLSVILLGGAVLFPARLIMMVL